MTDTDKPSFARAVAALALALRAPAPDATLLRILFDALRDLEIEFVVLAAQRLIVGATFFPKPCEWREMAATIEAERLEEQRALLRRLPTPLCAHCADTGWRTDGERRVRPCECRAQRRLEVLGRAPWPALPEGARRTTHDGALTPAESAAAIASLERVGLKLHVREMPSSTAD